MSEAGAANCCVSGKLMEKYNVADASVVTGGGEYPTQDGFGWTNGVLRKMLVLYRGAVVGVGCANPAANDNLPLTQPKSSKRPAAGR